jgi:outer membrane protein TolC
MRHQIRNPITWKGLLAALAIGLLAGCGSDADVKKRVDDQVYRDIDRHWKDDLGPKANYRVSDVAPSPDDVRAEPNLPGQLGTLTVPQAVALATGRNRNYQDRREALYARAVDLRLTRHQFEQRYFGGIAAGYRADRGAGYEADRKDAVIGSEASVGFNRLLADGTQVGVRIAGAWEDVLTGNLKGGLTALMDVSMVKPLLRGSDRSIVMEELTQADRDLLYEVRSFNQFRKDLVVSVIGDYYATLVLLDHFKNTESNHQALLDLIKVAAPLAEVGWVPAYDVDRVRQEILTSETTVLEARRRYEESLDRFKLKLGVPTATRFVLDPAELEALKASPLTCPNLGDQEVVDTAMARRLDLINEADRVVDAQRKVAVAKDRLRAELNLVATASGPGSHKANRQQLSAYHTNVGLGVEADLPLDRVAEEGEYRLALLAANQQQRQYEQTVDTIAVEVRQSYRRLKEAADRYQVCKKGVTLAQTRVQNTLLLLKHNRATTRRVLDSQSDLFDSQDQTMKALADYATATLEFYRDTGLLQIRADGMWQL